MKKRIISIVTMLVIVLTVCSVFSTSASAATYLIPDGIYMIRSKANQNLYLNVANARDADGTPVILYQNDNSAAGLWRVHNLGNNKVRLYSMASSSGRNRVMDMNMSAGKVDLYGIYNYVNDNTWYLKLESDGYITIRRAADLSKVVEAVDLRAGAQLSILSDKAWATQRWQFVPAGNSGVINPTETASAKGLRVAEEAKKWIGSSTLPNGSNGYYKCQAWVYQVVYRAMGGIPQVDKSRATAAEARRSWQVSTNRNIPIGAAVYFNITSSGHVGIYVGNNMVVHMWSQNGKGIVKMQSLDSIGNYVGWGWQAGYPLT